MSRIGKRFDLLKSQNRKALAAFITAGDPDLAATRKLFATIEKNGADIIEIGVPFTDPLADGPVIYQSALRSLKNGTTLKKILETVSQIRRESELPIVLMSSFNPIYAYGAQAFVDDALQAGVDGAIIPDLPPEEGEELDEYAREKGLDIIYLLAPNSTPERIKMVSERSRGFIYYISLTGITGTRKSLADNLQDKVAQIKDAGRLPVLIGFGISTPDQAAQAARVCDGVIVGSAIVKIIQQNKEPGQRETQVGNFVASLRQALPD